MNTSPRIALAFLSLLLLAAAPSPQPTWEQGAGNQETEWGNAQRTESQKEEQHTEESISKPVMVETNPHSTTDATHAEEKNANDWCNWYAAFGPNTWSNWSLLLAAATAGCLALRTLRLEYRPWVVATGLGDLTFLLKTGVDYLPFMLELKNAGKTPALHLTVKLEWNNPADGTPDTMPNDPEYKNARPFVIGAIGPSMTHQHRGEFDQISERQREDIEDGSRRFTICGLVEYCGHEKRSRRYVTKFCLLWDHRLKKFAVSGPYNDCT